MVELETSVIPNLRNKIKLWKRFVDDTYCLAKLEYIDNILTLNSFHKNKKFTFEIEKDNTIPFPDILIIRKPGKIETTVYRKKTCTDLYMNWYSFVSKSWKWGTLKTLVQRRHINCSTEKHLKEELNHIRKTFNEINNYPHWVITKVFKEIKEMTPSEKEIQVKEDENTSIKNHKLVLPYQGEKRIHTVNSMRRYVNKTLPKNVKVQTAFTGKRLRSCFKIKDGTKFEHQHDVIYQVKCSVENFWDDYTGKSARHIIERVRDYGGRDTKSHVLEHSSEKEHVEVTKEDFKIISSNFKNNRLKRKIPKVLLIKQKRPSLNVQDQSVELKLLS